MIMVDSQAKGKRAERALVSWLRDSGWPDARRFVQTGTGRDADQGDIRLEGPRGAGTVVLEVKHYAGGLTDSQVVAFLDKLRTEQCRPGELGILIERREGKADPDLWWAWLDLATLGKLQGTGALGADLVRMAVGVAMSLVVAYQRRMAQRGHAFVSTAPANPFADLGFTDPPANYPAGLR